MFHKCYTGRWANIAADMLPKLEGEFTRKHSTQPFPGPDTPHRMMPERHKTEELESKRAKLAFSEHKHAPSLKMKEMRAEGGRKEGVGGLRRRGLRPEEALFLSSLQWRRNRDPVSQTHSEILPSVTPPKK